MSQQTITTTPANSGLGDTLKVAFDKCNANFSEIYAGSPVFTGPMVIGPPASGVALTINGVAGNNALIVNSAVSAVGILNTTNVNGGYVTWQTNGTSIGDIGGALSNIGVGTGLDMAISTRGSHSLYFATNNANRMQIDGNGAVTIAAPAAGAGLTISDTTGISAITVLGTAGGNGAAIKLLGASGAQGKNFLVGNQFNVSNAFEITPSTANGGSTFTTPAFTVNGNGAVAIAVPASGDTLTVAPSASTGALVATSAALTNNAGASAGTLTNAPAAGNPTKWIKINDNGTIRSIPAW